MQYIKLTKGQMYDLVKKYSEYNLPDIEKTEYEKAFRAWAYWLRFTDPEGKHIVAYIEYCLGQARLWIRCKRDKYDVVFHPAPDELKEMIFEDGRDAPWIIRYKKTSEVESFRGTDIEVMQYAAEEGKRRQSDYVIT